MMQYRHGDILQAEAEALVNTVNCVGIMGRGVALQFKNAYPDNFKAYAAACAREEVRPGRARTDVCIRDQPAHPEVHHQFPDQTALAREEPDGRYRVGSC